MNWKPYSLLLITFFLLACSVRREEYIPASLEPVSCNFEVYSDLILIQAEINGVSGTFLFDNGFSNSALSPAFAEKVQIKFKGKTNIRDANNKRAFLPYSRIHQVKIEGHQFLNTLFYQIDTKLFFPCKQIDGVIGASIINKANWKIDFESQQISISSRPFSPTGFPMEIGFTDNNSTTTKVTLLDQTFVCKVDFGSTQNIELHRKYAAQAFDGLLAEEEYGIGSLSATGLGNVEYEYELKESFTLLHQSKEFPVKASVNLKNKLKYQGYLGIDFFKPYHVTINSTEKKYWLQKREDFTRTLPDSSYGISIYPIKDQWKIIQINPNDSLLSSIPLLSEVAQIDSIPMNQFNSICEFRSYWKEQKEKQAVVKIRLKGEEQLIPLSLHPSVYTPIPEQPENKE